MSELGLIYTEEPQQCDACGKIAELRPYGKDGACICFDCAMKDEPEAQRQFNMRVLSGSQNVPPPAQGG
jgi:hypothetical protein